jgi:hypothetical protein
MTRASFLVLLALLVAAGCQSPAPMTEAEKDEAPKVATGNTPQGEESTADAPAPDPASIPADVKTDAFEYYGLANSDPVPMEVIADGSPQRTGTQTTKLVKVEDGVATFEIARTGSLSALGTMTLESRKDGIYVKSTSIGEIEGEQLELPAGLTPGKTWKTSLKIKRQDGSTVENDSTFKVVRKEKVKTPAGEFDALLIESTGPMKMDGTESQMTTKGWFVKGRGAVKMTITTTPKGKKPTTMVIQETK